MAENIQAAACDESQTAAKRRRLDTAGLAKGDMAVAFQDDVTSLPLSSLEVEMFEDKDHPNKVLKGLNRLRQNGALCDVILCCGGQEFPCHRYVLASFSPYFEAMFTAGMRESTQERVTISGVEPQILDMLLSYAYTSKVPISTDNVQALMAATHMFEVTDVRDACCQYMGRNIDINNCVRMYCVAQAYSCKMWEKHSLDYILEHFSDIYQQEEFLSLSVERLTEILASDHLNVPKEDMVFEAAMLWLNKCPTRRQSFEKVLEHIRLPLITSSYRHTVVESLDVVKEYQGCKRFISEANAQDPVTYSNPARPRRLPEEGSGQLQNLPTSDIRVVILRVGAETEGRDSHTMNIFDPLTNQWKTIGRMPLKLRSHAVMMSGSTLYLAGGYQLQNTSSMCGWDEDAYNFDMWSFDLSFNRWVKMAPINEGRCNFNLVMLDGYVFAAGGTTLTESLSLDRYDFQTKTWQRTEFVVEADIYKYSDTAPAVVALDGLLYFIGTLCGTRNQPMQSQVATYNPQTSVWTKVPAMQFPRTKSAVCTHNGKIYVLGGLYLLKACNTVECFNPQTNQWTTCAPMEMQRYDHSAVAMDGKIYVLGGSERWRLPMPMNIERYSEETDTWETVGKMDTGCFNLKCVSLMLRKDYNSRIVSSTLSFCSRGVVDCCSDESFSEDDDISSEDHLFGSDRDDYGEDYTF